jgi:hypothetical protein
MTDTNPSGAPAAPAADNPAPVASAETPAGTFGSTRGSGLARGRRPSGAAAPAATPVKSDYKPTSVEVITHERAYQNPFASPEPANPPTPEPAKVEPPAAPAAEAPAPIAPIEPAAAAAPPALQVEEAPPEKPGIQILPPAEASRPALRWETPRGEPRGESRHEARPDVRHGDRDPQAHPEHRHPDRPERRDDRPEGREPRREGAWREGRPHFEPRPRQDQDAQPRARPEAEPAKKGFFAWLKGLFAGPKTPEAPVPQESNGASFGEGPRHRRRHRGGRGHGGHPQGYRGGRPEGADRGPQSSDRGPQGADHEHRGDDRHGGHRRRRHRGGQGRDRGGEPRSEGHQGGGAI